MAQGAESLLCLLLALSLRCILKKAPYHINWICGGPVPPNSTAQFKIACNTNDKNTQHVWYAVTWDVDLQSTPTIAWSVECELFQQEETSITKGSPSTTELPEELEVFPHFEENYGDPTKPSFQREQEQIKHAWKDFCNEASNTTKNYTEKAIQTPRQPFKELKKNHMIEVQRR
ncbi:UNVERIFIED_CONTAM: hypothetical protein FKN15_014325 [Acipenser sinensis]